MVLASLGVSLLWHRHALGVDAQFREGVVATQLPAAADPLLQLNDPVEQDIAALCYRDLMRLDNSAYPVPDLASRVTVSDDDLHYAVHLHAVRWSDGHALTAADVVATVTLLQHLSGNGIGRAWQGVAAKAGGASDVTFVLTRPRGGFLTLLAQTPILPLGSWSQGELRHPLADNTPLPATGPYVLTSLNNDGAVFDANSNAAEKPKLARIALRFYAGATALTQAFRHGDVDAMVAADPQMETQAASKPGTQVLSYTSFRFVDLVFNQRTPMGGDAAVTHAISESVDRGALVAGIAGFSAQPQAGAIPAGIAWAADATVPQPSPSAAAGLLQADGWEMGSDGIRQRQGMPLQLQVGVLNQAPLPAIAARLQSQLRGAGVEMKVQLLSPNQFAAALVNLGSMDALLGDWDNGPDPDVSTYWSSASIPPMGENIGAVAADPFLDQELERLATLTAKSDRRLAAAGVSKELNATGAAVFLYAPKVEYLVAPGFHVVVPPRGEGAAHFALVAQWAKG